MLTEIENTKPFREPTLEEILESEGRDLDESEIAPEEDDSESWRYYSDILSEKTVSYLFAYARRHPDDEFIEGRIKSLRQANETHQQRNGVDLPGYDAKYFTSTN